MIDNNKGVMHMCDISNRERITKLKEILEKETDEESGISKADIIKRLKEEFEPNIFKVNDKSIVEDIKTLSEMGFDVITEFGAHGKMLYSNKNKLFELYELRILIDAICSSRFITSEETSKIIEKIKRLTGTTLAKKLQNQIYIDGRVKSEDNQVRRWIDILHTSISDQKKVLFKYGNYNTDKEFTLHHNGEYYHVEPYALIWNNDYYYLVGILNNETKFRNFRVDRMRDVQIEDVIFSKKPLNISTYLNETFNMYPGESEMVIIHFDNQLINAVIDRLGTNINITKIDDNKFEVRFKAAINEGLTRWILMWGSDAEVISPKSLVEKIQIESSKMHMLYNK